VPPAPCAPRRPRPGQPRPLIGASSCDRAAGSRPA
jgi:hypothetical protein